MLVDMPVEDLFKYQGRSPRPADFDEFWDRSLAQLDAVDPEVELVKADMEFPYAECYHLYFNGVDGARIHAKLLKPVDPAVKRIPVVNFHGYGGDSGDWSHYARFAAAGSVVTALDVRSQGFESECDKGIYHNGNGQIFRDLDREPENLIYRNIFLDCARLARVTAEIAGTKQVVTHGGSQGGALSTACAALAPDVVKLALITFPFLSDYKRVWEMDLAVAAYDEIRTYFRKYDPRHEREDEVFTKLGYVDIQFLAPRITAEVLMVTGLMDTICPPSTQFAMYNKITSKKEVIFYPDFGHEGLPGLEDIYFKRVMAASLAE